jgi:hypothetical protein
MAANGFSTLVKLQFHASLAYPALLPGRMAIYQCIGFYIFCNNRTGADKGILTNLQTANNCGIGANSSPFTYDSGFKLLLALNKAAGINDIGKNGRWPNKHIVLNRYTIIYRYVVLDFYTIANHYIVIYKYVLTNSATVAYGAAGHQVAEMPYLSFGTYLSTSVYYGRRVYEYGIIHNNFSRRFKLLHLNQNSAFETAILFFRCFSWCYCSPYDIGE